MKYRAKALAPALVWARAAGGTLGFPFAVGFVVELLGADVDDELDGVVELVEVEEVGVAAVEPLLQPVSSRPVAASAPKMRCVLTMSPNVAMKRPRAPEPTTPCG